MPNESSTPPTSNMIQPPIITFLPPKQIEIMKERSTWNRSKIRTINYASETTIINHTNPTPQSRFPNKFIKIHRIRLSNFIQQQSRSSHHLIDEISNNNRQHRATIHPYLAYIFPQSNNISSSDSTPNLTTHQHTTLQESNITSTKPMSMRTPKDSPNQTYTKTSNHIRERIPSSKLQLNSIIQKLLYSSFKEQPTNNQNQQEGVISSTEGNERIICHQYKNNTNNNSDTAKKNILSIKQRRPPTKIEIIKDPVLNI